MLLISGISSVTSFAPLTSAGQLGYINLERLVACRMRFGRIGHSQSSRLRTR